MDRERRTMAKESENKRKSRNGNLLVGSLEVLTPGLMGGEDAKIWRGGGGQKKKGNQYATNWGGRKKRGLFGTKLAGRRNRSLGICHFVCQLARGNVNRSEEEKSGGVSRSFNCFGLKGPYEGALP